MKHAHTRNNHDGHFLCFKCLGDWYFGKLNDADKKNIDLVATQLKEHFQNIQANDTETLKRYVSAIKFYDNQTSLLLQTWSPIDLNNWYCGRCKKSYEEDLFWHNILIAVVYNRIANSGILSEYDDITFWSVIISIKFHMCALHSAKAACTEGDLLSYGKLDQGFIKRIINNNTLYPLGVSEDAKFKLQYDFKSKFVYDIAQGKSFRFDTSINNKWMASLATDLWLTLKNMKVDRRFNYNVDMNDPIIDTISMLMLMFGFFDSQSYWLKCVKNEGNLNINEQEWNYYQRPFISCDDNGAFIELIGAKREANNITRGDKSVDKTCPCLGTLPKAEEPLYYCSYALAKKKLPNEETLNSYSNGDKARNVCFTAKSNVTKMISELLSFKDTLISFNF